MSNTIEIRLHFNSTMVVFFVVNHHDWCKLASTSPCGNKKQVTWCLSFATLPEYIGKADNNDSGWTLSLFKSPCSLFALVINTEAAGGICLFNVKVFLGHRSCQSETKWGVSTMINWPGQKVGNKLSEKEADRTADTRLSCPWCWTEDRCVYRLNSDRRLQFEYLMFCDIERKRIKKRRLRDDEVWIKRTCCCLQGNTTAVWLTLHSKRHRHGDVSASSGHD